MACHRYCAGPCWLWRLSAGRMQSMISTICGQSIDLDGLAARVPLVSLTENGVVRAHDLWTESLERRLPAGRRFARRSRGSATPCRPATTPTAWPMSRFASETWRAIRVAARDLVRHTLSSLPVRRAQRLLAAADGDESSPELMLLQAALAHAVAVDDPRIDVLVDEATAMFAASGDARGETAALVLAGQVANSRGAYAQFLGIAVASCGAPGRPE